MTKSTPLCFFGNNQFSLTVLKSLIDNGWLISLVITKPAKTSHNKSRRKADNPIIGYAKENNLNILLSEDLSDVEAFNTIENTNTQVAVLASFGLLLPQNILNYFKFGIINIHPSLLPVWRGPSPIESALLAGDEQTGVSLIKLTKKMDAGPIFARQEINLNGNETQKDLYMQTAKIGAELLINSLSQIIDEQLKPTDQNENLATYSSIIKKSDGLINWNQDCQIIERQIRAFSDWPRSHAKLFDHDLIIAKVQTSNQQQNQATGSPYIKNEMIYVNCQTGSLIIERLQPAGRKEMSSTEFIIGYVSKY